MVLSEFFEAHDVSPEISEWLTQLIFEGVNTFNKLTNKELKKALKRLKRAYKDLEMLNKTGGITLVSVYENRDTNQNILVTAYHNNSYKRNKNKIIY